MPFNPPTGVFVWYKTDAIGSLADGTPVNYWLDSSGSGNNTTIFGSSDAPLFYNAKINGNPAVYFDGGVNYLSVSNNQSLNINTTDNTFFTVFNSLTTTLDQCVCSLFKTGIGVSALTISLNHLNPSGWNRLCGSTNIAASSITSSVNVFSTGNWYVRYDAFNLDTNTLYFGQNGATLSGGVATSNNTTLNNFYIGFSNIGGASPTYFSGYIAEIIGFNRKLTSNEITSVDNYLLDKYINAPTSGTTLTSPTSISGLCGWYKASSIGNLPENNSIQYWPDDSGSGNFLQKPPPAASSTWVYPTFHNNVINGWPVARWSTNIGNTYLQSQSFWGVVDNSGGVNSNPMCLWDGQLSTYCVFITNNSTNSQSIYSYTDFDFNTIFDIGINNVFINDFDFSATPSGSINPTTRTNIISANSTTFGTNMYDKNIFMIRSDRFKNSSSGLFFGRYGANVSSGYINTYDMSRYNTNAGNVFLTVAFNPTNNNKFTGDIAEILIYNRQLNDYEDESVQNYLMTKYMPGNVGKFPLFLWGNTASGLYKDISLYTNSSVSGQTLNTTLYTGSTQLSFSGTPLSISGLGQQTYSTSLYIPGSTQSFPPIILFIDGGEEISGNIPLYISNTSYISKTVNLYTDGLEESNVINSTDFPLYISGISISTKNNNTNLFLANMQSSSGDNANSLYSTIPLYLEAGAIYNSMPLVIYCPDNPNPSNYMPLYIAGPITTGYSFANIPLYLSNTVTQITSNPKRMFVKGDGILRDGFVCTSNLLSLVVGQGSGQSNNIPFYLYGISPASGGITLSISGTNYASENIPLYVNGTSATGYIPLYINSQYMINNNINLSVSGNQPVTGNTTLFAHGF